MTDLSVIAEQIAHIEKIANAWCNFALVCGCIGFALSVACAAYLICNYKKQTVSGNTINQKNGGEK